MEKLSFQLMAFKNLMIEQLAEKTQTGIL